MLIFYNLHLNKGYVLDRFLFYEKLEKNFNLMWFYLQVKFQYSGE